MNNVAAHKYLTAEERKLLMQKSDFQAAFAVVRHWLWIIGALFLVHVFPNPVTIVMALFILGGKQLACAILMHDASHQSVFKNTKLNNWIGQYLGAFPIFQNLNRYRPYHLTHHLNTGLAEDPDLLLTRGYPTTKQSMKRKIFRDLTGQTGLRAFSGLLLMNLGYLEYSLGGELIKIPQEGRSKIEFIKTIVHNLAGPVLTNLAMFGILLLLGNPWLYLLWVVAYFTTFQFVLRIRSMAEHCVVEDTTDPYKNTRTTYANFFEAILFAPYHVNYHAEHHLLMGVPSYNLPKMHGILKKKGFYEKGVLEQNYWNVIKLAMNKS